MLVYTHINHVLLDSPAGEGPFAVGRPSRVGPVGRGARPARPPGPTFGCRTPRARGGPPRTSAPTTHPAPTRPGARRTRAALGVGLSWRTRWRMKPRASQPQNHSPCPRASPRSVLTGRRPGPRSGRAGARPSRFTVVRPAPRAGRRGRRPLPPILPRRGLTREGLAPPSARGVRTGPAREGPAPPSAWDVRMSRVRDATAGGTLLILR